MKDFMDLIYWKPWSHAYAYFIGIYLGYFLSRMKQAKLSKVIDFFIEKISLLSSIYRLRDGLFGVRSQWDS
jgi:hypothetical protein